LAFEDQILIFCVAMALSAWVWTERPQPFMFFENSLSIQANSGHSCSSVQSGDNLWIWISLKSQTAIDNFECLKTRAVAAQYDFQAMSSIDKTCHQLVLCKTGHRAKVSCFAVFGKVSQIHGPDHFLT